LKHYRKGIAEHMMGVHVRYLDRGWFYARFVSGAGWGEWRTVGTGAAQF